MRYNITPEEVRLLKTTGPVRKIRGRRTDTYESAIPRRAATLQPFRSTKTKEQIKDYNLVHDYGMEAQRARSFRSPKKQEKKSARRVASDARRAEIRKDIEEGRKKLRKGMKEGGIMKAGKEYSVEEVGDETYGIDEIPMEWGRKKLDRKTEKLIQGTEFQVRGRYFNDNNGKGTF